MTTIFSGGASSSSARLQSPPSYHSLQSSSWQKISTSSAGRPSSASCAACTGSASPTSPLTSSPFARAAASARWSRSRASTLGSSISPKAPSIEFVATAGAISLTSTPVPSTSRTSASTDSAHPNAGVTTAIRLRPAISPRSSRDFRKGQPLTWAERGGGRGSNPRPLAPQARALPTELPPPRGTQSSEPGAGAARSRRPGLDAGPLRRGRRSGGAGRAPRGRRCPRRSARGRRRRSRRSGAGIW